MGVPKVNEQGEPKFVQPLTVMAPVGPVRLDLMRVCDATAVQGVAVGAMSTFRRTCFALEPNDDFAMEKPGGAASVPAVV